MPRFSFPLVIGEDPGSGQVVLGFEHDHYFIFDPAVSTCGRFEADPATEYQITAAEAAELKRLNNALEGAVEAALNAGCKGIQDALGVRTGDAAGMYFSGEQSRQRLGQMLAEYMLHEIALETGHIEP